MNGWIIPCIFKILFILTISTFDTLSYILRIPISWGYRPIFQICLEFWLKFWLYITLKHRPILLKIRHRNSKTPNTIADLSGSTVSQFPPTFPSSAVVPNSYPTSYSRFLLGWSHLVLPYGKPPRTDVRASSHSRQQGVFGECLLLSRPCGSLSASCAIAVSLGSACFRIEAMQTTIPKANVACHFPFHSDRILQNFSATSDIFGDVPLHSPANGKE